MSPGRLLAAGAAAVALLAVITVGGGKPSPTARAGIVVVPGATPVPTASSAPATRIRMPVVAPVVSTLAMAEPRPSGPAVTGGSVNRTAPPDAPNGGIDGSTQDYAAAHPDFLAP